MNAALLAVLLFLPILAFGAPVVDVPAIAGKTKDEVSKILGEPDSTSTVKDGEKAHYAKGDTEIVFIAGKADWITVSGLGSLPFSPATLEALGFKAIPPSFKNANIIRWKSVPGILEVSLFPGQKNCDYAYIVVKTRAQ